MSSDGSSELRSGGGSAAELASTSAPVESSFIEATVSEVSRTTSASSMADKCSEEDASWASVTKSAETCSISRSSSSRRSDDWSFSDFDLSKSKLPQDEAWWAPLAADTVRLAEDIAQGGAGLLPAWWRIPRMEPKKVWKRFRRYRYFLLFVSTVTVINGLFSILLLQCLLGTSKVCMFGSCRSPHYTPASALAYDRSNLSNMTQPQVATLSLDVIPPATPTPEYSDADDEAFMNEVAQDWDVSPHPSVPRAYSLLKKQGHYRALLVQDICYLFMQGSGPHHGRPTGVWFDADTVDAVRAADTRGVLDARELQKLDLIQLLLDQPEDEGDQPEVHKGAFKLNPDFFKAQKRVNRTVGSFVGPRGLSDYLQYSSNTAIRHLKGSEQARPRLIGLVGGFESNIASFSSNSVFLSEVVSSSASLLQSSAVFFPGDRTVWSKWTEGALKAAVGAESSAVAGQKQGQPFCFRNVVFLLSERPPAVVEIDNFRQKAWKTADAAVDFVGKHSDLLSPDSVQSMAASAQDDVRLQLGYSSDVMRTVRLLKQVAAAPSRFQVTVLVDSVNDGAAISSKIGNLDALMSLTRRMFPKMDVLPFSLAQSSFVEQAAVFKRTVLLISPYGLAAGSTILLPRGASIVEIFPYMFRSEATMSTARAAGVNYLKWENNDITVSTYDDNCFITNNFQSLTVTECRRYRPCLFCVRDHVSTLVDRKQVWGVLGKAQQAVKTFLEASRKNGAWSSSR